MTKYPWFDEIDPALKDHLDYQIKETHKHKHVLNKSKEPSKVQLWLAIANLTKQIHELTLKLNYLERALQQVDPKKIKKTSKEEQEQIKKIMKNF